MSFVSALIQPSHWPYVAPIILLFWLYLLATCLLLGGELNALLDERRARDATESA